MTLLTRQPNNYSLFVLIFHKLCVLQVKKCFHTNMFYLERIREEIIETFKQDNYLLHPVLQDLALLIKIFILFHTMKQQFKFLYTTIHVVIYY